MRYIRVENTSRGTVLGGRIRIADDFRSRTFGLLGAKPPEPGEGLLLIPCRAIHMLGMRFPLDVLFLDERGEVLSAHHALPPGPRFRWSRHAASTLELPPGTLRASGTRRGDVVLWTPADGGVDGPQAPAGARARHDNRMAQCPDRGHRRRSDEPRGDGMSSTVKAANGVNGDDLMAPPEIPPVPETLQDTGLTHEKIADLVLKLLYVQGARTGDQIQETICLPFGLLDDVLLDLQQRRFIEVRGTQGHGREGYLYDIGGEGRGRAKEALEQNQYVGAAPVPLWQYKEWVKHQTIAGVTITRSRIREGFTDLVLDEHMFEMLGPAVNSAKSLFLYGEPGNGKTHIAETIARLLGKGGMYIPQAVDIDGQIMIFYDPVHHQRLDEDEAEGHSEEGVESLLFRKRRPMDRRFVKIARPVVVTGGELTLDQLDLQYDQQTKMYQAPFQVKANGGVLIIDDFGRQRVPPHELLNRWIVPLEKRKDFLTLHTGVKFPVPFDCLLIFATNLDPSDLVDEAFMRRIHYKVRVHNPPREAYDEIFRRQCEEKAIKFDVRAVDYIYRKYYDGIGIEPRGCHPRDLTDHLCDFARYHEREPVLTPDLIDHAAESYFLVMAAEKMRGATMAQGAGGTLGLKKQEDQA